jgi:hypothetical protein
MSKCKGEETTQEYVMRNFTSFASPCAIRVINLQSTVRAAQVANTGQIRSAHKLLDGNLKGREQLIDLGVDGQKI